MSTTQRLMTDSKSGIHSRPKPEKDCYIKCKGHSLSYKRSIIMKNKANIGIVLVVAFAATLITGIILHLKGHGILVQPRGVLKAVHWISGYAMTVLLCIHWSQFHKMLGAMKRKFGWFYADTWVLIILFLATLLTGTVKLLSPSKSRISAFGTTASA